MRISHIAILCGMLLNSGTALAWYQTWSPSTITYNTGNITITNSQHNVIGYTQESNQSITNGSYTFIDHCSGNEGPMADGASAMIRVTSPYPVQKTVGSYKYVKSNSDYLLFGASGHTGNHTVYAPTTSTSWGTPGEATCNTSNPTKEPVSWTLSVYIARPFIGTVNINEPNLFTAYIGGNGDGLSNASYHIGFQGTMVVPQTCTIEPDSVFQIDLGQIAQKAFTTGGAGNRPTGFINRPLTVKLSCAGGVQQDAALTMRLEGTVVSSHPQSLASNNADIGIIVTQPDGTTILQPNDINSFVPFKLANGSGSAVIQSYPISLTGRAPAVGLFTTLASLRFDFE